MYKNSDPKKKSVENPFVFIKFWGKKTWATENWRTFYISIHQKLQRILSVKTFEHIHIKKHSKKFEYFMQKVSDKFGQLFFLYSPTLFHPMSHNTFLALLGMELLYDSVELSLRVEWWKSVWVKVITFRYITTKFSSHVTRPNRH